MCLLRAAQLPGGHYKLVKARINQTQEEGGVCFFEPSSALETKGVLLAETVAVMGAE